MFAPLLPLRQLTLSRREFRDALEERGIGTGMSYEAAHLATLYRRFGYHRSSLPHTERIADTTVTLPLHPMMTDDDVDRVCDACADVINAHRR
jgi:dTDP-4-amino-4,6-dideoxygalactose transaminase